MKSYVAFTKKEFSEATHTYKLLIMECVFLLLGMMNPITAKITPQLIKSFMPAGMNITIPEPTALDSWAQFFKNVPQLGLIVLVIIFSGSMANEFSHGTLINMLTKGLSRHVVLLSKFTMEVSLWTAGYVLCFGLTDIYTAYFWSGDGIKNIVFAVFCLWLFGILLLSCMLFAGVLIKSNYGCLLVTGGFVAVLFLINIIPKLQKYNPIMLASKNMSLLTSEMTVSDFKFSILLCCIAIIVFLASAVALFQKKQV